MESDQIIKILLAVILLATIFGGVTLLLTGKGTTALEHIKDIIRFGR